jgi:hypothetical protein
MGRAAQELQRGVPKVTALIGLDKSKEP